MISEVKVFLEEFFKAELVAYNAYIKPDLDKSNLAVSNMYSFCSEALYNGLNMSVRDKLHASSFYEDDSYEYEYPRFLFKLSQYDHPDYGDLYLAYVTQPAMQFIKFLKISHCLFVTKIDGEYKIICDYFVDNENPRNIHWHKAVGIDNVSVSEAGKFIEVKRYQEPSYDAKRRLEESEFSKTEYEKDR